MATPFHERSPCHTASYPSFRRALTGKAPCSALSSWRLTTSGCALASHAKRLSSRLLMLLMLKVATLTGCLTSSQHFMRLPHLGIRKQKSKKQNEEKGTNRPLLKTGEHSIGDGKKS